MLRFLIIMALAIYVISKIGGFFFRAGVSSQQNRYPPRSPSDGKINVDAAPHKERRSGNIKGGDYVDYEEVK